MERIRTAPKKKIFDETVSWPVKSRIDARNEEAINNLRRSTVKSQVKFLHLIEKIFIRF
jgi:hypothetical protein